MSLPKKFLSIEEVEKLSINEVKALYNEYVNPKQTKIFSNFPKQIKKSYKNYLTNKIIENFDITDSKVNLIFSASKNPFS